MNDIARERRRRLDHERYMRNREERKKKQREYYTQNRDSILEKARKRKKAYIVDYYKNKIKENRV